LWPFFASWRGGGGRTQRKSTRNAAGESNGVGVTHPLFARPPGLEQEEQIKDSDVAVIIDVDALNISAPEFENEVEVIHPDALVISGDVCVAASFAIR